MGYSCTVEANKTLNAIGRYFATNGNPNILTIEGTEYFFERGRENADGAITGSLMEMLPNDYCRKAGRVRIDGDGKLAAFPCVGKAAIMLFRANMERDYPGMLNTAGNGSML